MLWLLACFVFIGSAFASEVEVVKVSFERQGGTWQVRTTLRHGDTGWGHYADAWRVVDENGTVLGTRTLYHPHENEQPFTRSLNGVTVPSGASRVFVEAHDKLHGWAKQRVAVDLGTAHGARFEVRH